MLPLFMQDMIIQISLVIQDAAGLLDHFKNSSDNVVHFI